jgi:hypothetical protein
MGHKKERNDLPLFPNYTTVQFMNEPVDFLSTWKTYCTETLPTTKERLTI